VCFDFYTKPFLMQVLRHRLVRRRQLIRTLYAAAVLAVFGVCIIFHGSYSFVFYSGSLRTLQPQNVSHLLLRNRSYHTCIPYIINQEMLCGSDAVDYLFVVMSAIENFENRVAVRESWGKEAIVFARGRLVFLVGKNVASQYYNLLEDESHVSVDIVQVDLLDIAENHVLKTVAMLQWTRKHCPQARFVVKTQDATFVHIANLLKTTHSKVEDALYADMTPDTNNRNLEWMISSKVYARKGFNSGMYIIGGRAVELLYKATGHVKPVHYDDRYLTELCAVSVGVPRFPITGIDGSSHYSICMASDAVFISPVTSRRIQELWRD
ncbi:unnamed protein product, partial [Ixodes pacificus]